MEQMKVQQVGNTEIFVGSDGKFRAIVNGKEVMRSSLTAVVSLIQKSEKSVKVMIPNAHSWNPSFATDDITHTSGKTLVGKYARYHQYKEVFYYDPVAAAEFEKIQKEYNELHKRWREVEKRLIRVDPAKFTTGVQEKA